MTTLNLSAFNQIVSEVESTHEECFDSHKITLKDVILSLPFKQVSNKPNAYFSTERYVLDTGSHYIEYEYAFDEQDCEDDHNIFINKSKRFAYGAEKTNRSHGRYVHRDILRFVAFIKPLLEVGQETKKMTILNEVKSSYTKKDIKDTLVAVGVCEHEIDRALTTLKKTMIGKAEALPFMVHTCISYYSDETGLVYNVDQLIVDLDKRLGKTFTSQVLNENIIEIWNAVSSALSQYPEGRKLVYSVLVGVKAQFKGKSVVGIAQVKEAIYTHALVQYKEVK